MANNKQKNKELARALYMSGESTERICELAGVCRQTLSRWISKGGWDITKKAISLTPTELKKAMLEKTSSVLDDPEQAAKMSKSADAICKMVKSMNQIDKESTIVQKIDALIGFENWLMDHGNDYEGDMKGIVSLIHRMHNDYLTSLTGKK